ncbi:predicted protein [Histoplasma capsulatum G186AR]|uniref:Uncharacterized protein n=1 Tax=Ajellomyces capsulatus (strain G186AR / H82 / ATCC MYA-2454 / RMSCC 2432) TaxID=447093 RepID=C0P099_AJECG|nr:uncharacterized protein HCBG_08818 [Histoplasma capsulatum G186AR]EEH02915.1 predicted protein [Histoplasma capsulatum G186AR]
MCCLDRFVPSTTRLCGLFPINETDVITRRRQSYKSLQSDLEYDPYEYLSGDERWGMEWQAFARSYIDYLCFIVVRETTCEWIKNILLLEGLPTLRIDPSGVVGRWNWCSEKCAVERTCTRWLHRSWTQPNNPESFRNSVSKYGVEPYLQPGDIPNRPNDQGSAPSAHELGRRSLATWDSSQLLWSTTMWCFGNNQPPLPT